MEFVKTLLVGMTLILISFKVIKDNFPSRSIKNFFITSFLITSILFLFVLIKPHHLLHSKFNYPNTFTYLLIALIFVFYLFTNFKLISQSNFFLFILSLVSFSLAIFYDLLNDIKILYFQWSDFIEEIFRIIGSLFWLLYFIFYKIEIESE